MPHADETFYKMKCGWAGDPKVVALARFGPVDACLARDLFGQMIDYSRRELTDGLVPGEVVPLLAHPLPADDAMRVAMHLADPGAYGPLCGWDAPSNAGSNAPSNAPSNAGSNAGSNAFRILAYGKWNDTRAEVQARKEKGSKAARARWDGADAGADAGSNAGGNANGIHRARGRVDTEQEQEQEQETASVVTDPDTRVRAPEAADDHFELDGQIVAILHGKGRTVTRADAATIRTTLLAGKAPRDPARYVLGIVRKDPNTAIGCLPNSTASRQPPAARTLCGRCQQPGHDAQHCPTLRDPGERPAPLRPGPPRPAAEVATHGASTARKMLAEAAAPPDPAPADQPADDEDSIPF